MHAVADDALSEVCTLIAHAAAGHSSGAYVYYDCPLSDAAADDARAEI